MKSVKFHTLITISVYYKKSFFFTATNQQNWMQKQKHVYRNLRGQYGREKDDIHHKKKIWSTKNGFQQKKISTKNGSPHPSMYGHKMIINTFLVKYPERFINLVNKTEKKLRFFPFKNIYI